MAQIARRHLPSSKKRGKMGTFKIESSPIVSYTFQQYPLVLASCLPWY